MAIKLLLESVYNQYLKAICQEKQQVGDLVKKYLTLRRTTITPLCLQKQNTSQASPDVKFQNFLPLTQVSFTRETTNSARTISFQNLSSLDSETNKMYVNDVFEEYRDDRINFIGAIGYEETDKKAEYIDISDEPLIIISGIQYFLLKSQSCSPDILKILYTLCQSVYVTQKMLPQFQNNLNRFIDVSEAWDIKNYLYIMSNHFQNQSQIKTSAETKQIYDQYHYDADKSQIKANRISKISMGLQKYFSEIIVVNQSCLTQFGQYAVKDHIQKNFKIQSSKWHTSQAVLKGYIKIITGSKILSLKELHKLNVNLILDQFQEKVMNNFQIFSFQTIRSYNRNKDYSGYKLENRGNHERQEGDKELERQRQKEKFKERERLKKLKKNIMLPFFQAEQTWIGRTELFRQRYLQIRQKIEQEYDKILVTLNEKDEKFIIQEIDNISANLNTLQALGNSKFDGLSINFSSYIKKMKTCLTESIKSSLRNKKWAMKNRVVGDKGDVLSNLDSRIEINERKKETLEIGIKLALKQYEYLSALMRPERTKVHAFQIER